MTDEAVRQMDADVQNNPDDEDLNEYTSPIRTSFATTDEESTSSGRKKRKGSKGFVHPSSSVQVALEKLDKLEKKMPEPDECDAFAEYLATQLRKLTQVERAVMIKTLTNTVQDYLIDKYAADDPFVNIVVQNNQ